MITKKIVIILIILFVVTGNLFSSITDKDLHYVMPSATSFSVKYGKYPHWDAFIGDKVIGICFLTTDIDSSIKGYVGPIKILVGIYKNRIISGIKIISHMENIPEADRIREDWFQLQFSGKSLDDPFVVGKDIDGITGATITVKAVIKSVKRTSKIMAEIFFPYSKAGRHGLKLKKTKIKTSVSTKKRLNLSNINKDLYYYLFAVLIFFIFIFIGINIKLKKNKKLLVFIILFEIIFLLTLVYLITLHSPKTENIKRKIIFTVKKETFESNVKNVKLDTDETNKKEEILLHPKWGIERINKDKFKRLIKQGELSGKEAYNYKVISDEYK